MRLRRTDSITQPDYARTSSEQRRSPFLLLVGDAAHGGGLNEGGVPTKNGADRVVPLPAELTIGRRSAAGDADPGGDSLAFADKLMSKVHAKLRRTPGGCELEDAHSLNGTLVDGRRISTPVRLSEGALLAFGGHVAVFRKLDDDSIAAINEDLASPFAPVATISGPLANASAKLRRLAVSGSDIFITGETGTGKEVYAQAVHRTAARQGRFVAINCAAIPHELVESELFGVARGAHSTATQARPGLLEAAHGGTLFLDEIGDMPAAAQAKLLRFLQEREVVPLGSTTPRSVDVRVVAATNNAEALSRRGGLRADLAARLGAEPINLPPLRSRIEDLGALMVHFQGSAGARPFDAAAFHALCLHAWPGNVRELQKVVQEAMAICDHGAPIGLKHLPERIRATLIRTPREGAMPPAVRRATPTRAELEALLREHHGNVASVARALDRQWAVVWRWLVKHDLDASTFRER
ncbi:MAG TPA: sigma 54-interacting transcriptional regulator [Polyangia bacterium]|nr:sigma 54-interacting transcriptional regulator [Polyangia bacterium]